MYKFPKAFKADSFLKLYTIGISFTVFQGPLFSCTELALGRMLSAIRSTLLFLGDIRKRAISGG